MPVFWIALAATHLRLGRLEPSVRDQALAHMERDVARWDRDAPRLARRRRRALQDLRVALLGPGPRAWPESWRGTRIAADPPGFPGPAWGCRRQ